MRTQIFISYRRDGGLEVARQLHALLQEDYAVFFDKESLRNGKFDEKIEQAICRCTDFLLILSGNIFDRFEDEGDWISRELTLALEQGKNVIPIFLPGFQKPASENEVIKTALRYNGVVYAQNDAFREELTAFLESNKKCVLEVACTVQGYKLTQSAVETLKEAYRKMAATGNCGVHVVLALPDAAKAAKKLAAPENEDFMCQHLLRRYRSSKNTLECAIEFMMGDVKALSTLPLQGIMADNPIARTVFELPSGERQNYYYVAVWVEVIENLLEEITVTDQNRLVHYRYLQEYTGVQFVFDTFPGAPEKYWYFPTVLRNSEMPYADYRWYKHLRPTVAQLSAQSIVKFVLPAYYYRVVENLEPDANEELRSLLQNPDADIRFLGNYWYGFS